MRETTVAVAHTPLIIFMIAHVMGMRLAREVLHVCAYMYKLAGIKMLAIYLTLALNMTDKMKLILALVITVYSSLWKESLRERE
jgi:hypothetical protein